MKRKNSAASPACNVEGPIEGPKSARALNHPLVDGAAEEQPKFGDPRWIANRGLRPKRPRRNKGAKTRASYIKPDSSKRGGRQPKQRHAPIWQRIEGEWKPYRCRACRSVSFTVIDEEDIFVNVRCAAGHNGKVLKGFAMTKPDG